MSNRFPLVSLLFLSKKFNNFQVVFEMRYFGVKDGKSTRNVIVLLLRLAEP
jgi:hypothetical protein